MEQEHSRTFGLYLAKCGPWTVLETVVGPWLMIQTTMQFEKGLGVISLADAPVDGANECFYSALTEFYNKRKEIWEMKANDRKPGSFATNFDSLSPTYICHFQILNISLEESSIGWAPLSFPYFFSRPLDHSPKLNCHLIFTCRCHCWLYITAVSLSPSYLLVISRSLSLPSIFSSYFFSRSLRYLFSYLALPHSSDSLHSLIISASHPLSLFISPFL